ncbi:TSSK [Mytilus coruscus]|uniref:TSSK n=1 Tax=Mytilus coruscus TaxID=42192 RepID=A0A6J8CFT2_MYTCO|nr:TSSK [Mytilus coruscus]
MEFLMNSGLLNVVALTEEVFSASSEVFGKVAIKKVLKTSTEFEAFLSLKHENIVEAIEIIEAEEFAFVLMEFAEFGDIVKAVEYCHSIGIAHNDIKLENVLLSNGCVKLADFGFAKSSVIVAESEEFCGTLPYAAPEVIMEMEHNTMKADMWSMGVMLYVMLFGAFPFSDKNVLLSNGCVKLADFGFAKSSVIVAESEEFCGTLPYAAPEVIMGMEHNTMKADMWSMGVMLTSCSSELSHSPIIVKAVEYCHSIGIAHNDIKLENVLLSNGCVKLADFGFAKSSVIVAESEEFCGTLPYAAPEVIMGMEHNTMKADMWSMGVMLYVMLFGAFPFSDSDATSMVQAQISNTLFSQKTLTKC